MIRVLIADDQPLMRTGFKTVLEATGMIEVVAEADNGLEAIAAAEQFRPDVILMDIRMPGMDGLEATRRLPREKILVLTTFGLDEYIVEALRAGASGFLTKDVPRQELVAAVKAVAAGDAVLSPQVTRQLLDRVAHRLPATHADRRRRRRAHRPRARGPAADRRRALERGDRRRAGRGRADRQAPRLQPARQARPQRPRAGRDLRLRERRDRAAAIGRRPIGSVTAWWCCSVNVSVLE